MLKNLKKENSGFTIIEVLIVLAIAGLIMLIVFMAVPALQRNSRNTQRKSDVSAMLGAVSEYVSNNGGRLPTTSGDFSAAFVNAVPNLGFYESANADYSYSASARGAVPAFPAGNDIVVVYNYLKCSNATTPTVTGASSRSIAALYKVEGSSSDVNQCQES